MSYVVACGGHCELSACGLSLPRGQVEEYKNRRRARSGRQLPPAGDGRRRAPEPHAHMGGGNR